MIENGADNPNDVDAEVTDSEAAAIESERWEMVLAQWLSGFDEHPGTVTVGKFAIARAQADACGVDDEFQLRAALKAGKAKTPNLLEFLDPDPELEPGKREAFLEATDFLDRFIAAEVVPAMRRAIGENGGEWFNTFADALIGVAETLRRHEEEQGRDSDLLERWLDGLLPRGKGSKYLVMATAEWDDAWRGRAGHAALECRNEVLEHAIALALMEVPT
ncbi:hypothetical protein AB0L65_32865 [Nonomuraea sp. NPDC052116]|uniref:hypothetical protein n=1 Tax=Nonomuraea sp. NPDC052116 TaxID=3155665 RepID=UPI00343A07AA